MKGRILGAVVETVVFSAVCVAAASSGAVWNFDRDQPDAINQDFIGESGQWEVVKDATAPSQDHVLAQLAKSSTSTFNVALVRDTNLRSGCPSALVYTTSTSPVSMSTRSMRPPL